jgi:hypothetical protein
MVASFSGRPEGLMLNIGGCALGRKMAMKISSFKSIVGVTWVVSDGYCNLGYFKSQNQARKRRAEIIRARKAREAARQKSPLAPPPPEDPPPGSIVEGAGSDAGAGVMSGVVGQLSGLGSEDVDDRRRSSSSRSRQ